RYARRATEKEASKDLRTSGQGGRRVARRESLGRGRGEPEHPPARRAERWCSRPSPWVAVQLAAKAGAKMIGLASDANRVVRDAGRTRARGGTPPARTSAVSRGCSEASA